MLLLWCFVLWTRTLMFVDFGRSSVFIRQASDNLLRVQPRVELGRHRVRAQNSPLKSRLLLDNVWSFVQIAMQMWMYNQTRVHTGQGQVASEYWIEIQVVNKTLLRWWPYAWTMDIPALGENFTFWKGHFLAHFMFVGLQKKIDRVTIWRIQHFFIDKWYICLRDYRLCVFSPPFGRYGSSNCTLITGDFPIFCFWGILAWQKGVWGYRHVCTYQLLMFVGVLQYIWIILWEFATLNWIYMLRIHSLARWWNLHWI